MNGQKKAKWLEINVNKEKIIPLSHCVIIWLSQKP